jgi:hypothetical protein
MQPTEPKGSFIGSSITKRNGNAVFVIESMFTTEWRKDVRKEMEQHRCPTDLEGFTSSE